MVTKNLGSNYNYQAFPLETTFWHTSRLVLCATGTATTILDP